MVIADAKNATAVAGVIGGGSSEVTELTRELAVESANFNPARVRRTARAIGVRTEASSRHERALSLAMPDLASLEPHVCCSHSAGRRGRVRGGRAYRGAGADRSGSGAVSKLLGFSLGDGEAAGALRSLGFDVETRDGSTWAIPPPMAHRRDDECRRRRRDRAHPRATTASPRSSRPCSITPSRAQPTIAKRRSRPKPRPGLSRSVHVRAAERAS